MNRKKFYFLHIPKTGGASVNAWLHSHGSLNICPDWSWSQILSRDKQSLSDYDVFSGHFFTFLQDYIKSDLNTFTFLRNPIERSISQFLYIKRIPEHYLYKRARELSFMEFMVEPETASTLFNYQTRTLSMQGIEHLNGNGHGIDPFALEGHKKTQTDSYSSDVNLPKAMDFLDSCFFVGLTECMDESLHKLAIAMEIEELTAPTPFVNMATNSVDCESLTNDEYKMLMSLIRDDLALYQYAKHLFATRPQTRPQRLQNERDSSKPKIHALENELARLHAHIEAIHNTLSWRVTKPIRWMKQQIKSFFI